MLEIQNISFRYSRRRPPVLEDFSLAIREGGVYGLLGPNGAGKSTLLYLVSGLLQPMSGRVLYNNVETRRRLPETTADIFLVPEEFTLPAVSLDEYIKYNAPFYPRFSRDDVERSLEMFGLTSDLNLGQLSMGQKKKVFMSFALACNTRLLLMDEPTNGLDIPGKSAFRRFIAESTTDEKTVVISTHQVRDIDRLLDHVLIMNEKNIVLDRSVVEIQRAMKFFQTNDPEEIQRALYMLPSLGGASVITPNTDDEDTEINLETLFDFAMKDPEAVNQLFNENVRHS